MPQTDFIENGAEAISTVSAADGISEFWQHFDPLTELQLFLDQGGDVLWLVMSTLFLLWWLVLERHYYFWKLHTALKLSVIEYWRQRRDHHSWYAHQIRRRLISLVRIKSEKNLAVIKAIVVIAPLLGLLGTVTGMIDVFEVMALSSSSNTRAMAAGVSKATIPTMAGMVVAVIGLLFEVRLQKKAHSCVDEISAQLELNHTK